MGRDRGSASDHLGIGIHNQFGDGGRNRTVLRIEKWDLDQIAWAERRNARDLRFDPAAEPGKAVFDHFSVHPFEVFEDSDANLITAAGWALCIHTGAWLGSAGTLFSTTVGRIGLGIGSTAATYADVALTTSTGWTGNNWILCGVAPTYTAASGGTGASLAFAATFTTSSFNASAVTEFAVDQGTASGTSVTAPMVNHGVNGGGYGTKTSSQTWNTTATLTFT